MRWIRTKRLFRSLRPDFIETTPGRRLGCRAARLFRSLRPDFIETTRLRVLLRRRSRLFRSLRPDFIETAAWAVDIVGLGPIVPVSKTGLH